MTSFLNNLAGLARGETPAGAARLSLPSRFAGPAAPVSVETEEFGAKPDDATPSAPATPLATSPQTPGAIWARADEAPTRPAARAEAADLPQIREPLATPRAAALRVPQTQEAGPMLPSDPSPFEPRLSHPVQMQRLDPTAAEVGRQTVITRALEQNPLIPPPASPIAGLEGRPMPMSEAAMAGRDGLHPPERPVVHVTIDRLEVRAQAPQKPTPEEGRRPRPEPTVSLADYLSANGSGGRA